MYKKDLYGKTIRKKIVFHGGFYMFGLIIALISGALMSIQGVFNTEVTKQSSTWTTSTFVQATGFLACLLINYRQYSGHYVLFIRTQDT